LFQSAAGVRITRLGSPPSLFELRRGRLRVRSSAFAVSGYGETSRALARQVEPVRPRL